MFNQKPFNGRNSQSYPMSSFDSHWKVFTIEMDGLGAVTLFASRKWNGMAGNMNMEGLFCETKVEERLNLWKGLEWFWLFLTFRFCRHRFGLKSASLIWQGGFGTCLLVALTTTEWSWCAFNKSRRWEKTNSIMELRANDFCDELTLFTYFLWRFYCSSVRRLQVST